VELFAFDKAYVERLRDGDSATESHFVTYFDELLRIKLRARFLAPDTVDELRQETFTRVVAALRTQGGIRQPERFGAFVNSICNNVLMEHYRSSSRSQPLEDFHLEKTDKVLDLEGLLVTREVNESVRAILEALPERDRRLLRAIFFEEKDKDEVCKTFGVDRGYLRVLLHRAKDKFRASYVKEPSSSRPPKAATKGQG
jgi:RNA polymerase sigma-70 factor, ECF subfamily